MGRALDRGLKQEDKDKQYDALFNAVATVLSTEFSIWLPSLWCVSPILTLLRPTKAMC